MKFSLESPRPAPSISASDLDFIRARTGQVTTTHGVFETPNFMPVGTQGTVKGIDAERLAEVGSQIILVNTYHLWLRPGQDLVHNFGGIHSFMAWPGPILSDSGGYQVFSLRGIRTLTEAGVTFRSHLDGSPRFLSPELAVQIQETLGVDIAMVLDECPAAGLSREDVQRSLHLTHRWAQRCVAARSRPQTSLFGITQGGRFLDLRTESAAFLSELDLDGVAIGGLSVGEAKETMYEVLAYHVPELPLQKVRYLMGVGTPRDIVEGVKNGVDLFDCVMPTRAGRFGRAFVQNPAHEGAPFINIRNSRFITDQLPLDSECQCVACRNYSRGYLHHLFRAKEMLGPQLLSIHNLTHYLSLMRRIREAIRAGNFSELYRQESARWDTVGKPEER